MSTNACRPGFAQSAETATARRARELTIAASVFVCLIMFHCWFICLLTTAYVLFAIIVVLERPNSSHFLASISTFSVILLSALFEACTYCLFALCFVIAAFCLFC